MGELKEVAQLLQSPNTWLGAIFAAGNNFTNCAPVADRPVPGYRAAAWATVVTPSDANEAPVLGSVGAGSHAPPLWFTRRVLKSPPNSAAVGTLERRTLARISRFHSCDQ